LNLDETDPICEYRHSDQFVKYQQLRTLINTVVDLVQFVCVIRKVASMA